MLVFLGCSAQAFFLWHWVWGVIDELGIIKEPLDDTHEEQPTNLWELASSSQHANQKGTRKNQ